MQYSGSACGSSDTHGHGVMQAFKACIRHPLHDDSIVILAGKQNVSSIKHIPSAFLTPKAHVVPRQNDYLLSKELINYPSKIRYLHVETVIVRKLEQELHY